MYFGFGTSDQGFSKEMLDMNLLSLLDITLPSDQTQLYMHIPPGVVEGQ